MHPSSEEKTINFKKLPGCVLITQSAWRNSQNAANGGVGLVVNKAAESVLSDVNYVNKRILIATFNGNPSTTVIVNYSPQEGTQDAVEHYDKLIDTIKQVPKHNLLLVLGDFNAHIGKVDGNFTYHEKTNNNGQLFLDLALQCKMQITNTKFQKKHSKLWTYVSDMTNLKSQVDYILINCKWSNSVKDVCAHNSFTSIGSDHRLLRAKIKMSFRTKKTPAQIRHDWALLRGNKDLQQTFTISLQNRFAILCDNNDNIDATQRYEYFIQANKETAENLIPKKKRVRTNKTFDDPRIIRAREDVQRAFNTFQHS